MTLAISLRNASRNLINTFGNTAILYSFTTATKTTTAEGDVSVSSWGTGATIKVVDGENLKEELIQAAQGMESIGNDEKIVRDDAALAVNDRLNIDSVDYRITAVRPVRTQNTLVIQIITVNREDQVAYW